MDLRRPIQAVRGSQRTIQAPAQLLAVHGPQTSNEGECCFRPSTNRGDSGCGPTEVPRTYDPNSGGSRWHARRRPPRVRKQNPDATSQLNHCIIFCNSHTERAQPTLWTAYPCQVWCFQFQILNDCSLGFTDSPHTHTHLHFLSL